MTNEQRNIKLQHLITCMKCETSGKVCDENCPTQYEAGNMGEIIENLEAISEALEQQPCEDLINQRATTCRHGGHCEWVACDKCNHYEPTSETITNSTSGYLEVVLSECEDCISRQAVEDAIYDATRSMDLNYGQIMDYIDKLPSVTPKQEPCDDCISRQAVLKILKNNRYRFNISQEGNCEGKVLWSEKLIKNDACEEIEQLPSVTPKEKTGKWIDEADDIDAQFGRHEYKCSVCGRIANYYVGGNECWWDIYKPNFCPNCGCRMRGDSNGNE